jgi:FAD/FMN-containing dehydrogenase
MNRRRLLQIAAALPVLAGIRSRARAQTPLVRNASRVRPGDPAWPSAGHWERLNRETSGRLIRVKSPLAECADAPSAPACAQVFKQLKNPYYLGDEPALTQTLGWVDAWTSKPSEYAVAAETTADIVAAVNFARENNLRLVVKGGGHSYQGTSNAADSLLIWTRKKNAITLHDTFVGAGCTGRDAPQRAVTVEAGAIWGQVYNAVTTRAGRYVQGGGCMTVGVAGLIQSGGFGSFSKAYGMAAASLLETEIVTANGAITIANACTNPDLFWAIKGGGGGSLGVVTRLTLRTHNLPEFFGGVFFAVKASSDDSFRRLIERAIGFYAESLFNPNWGEQISFRPGNLLSVAMVFQDIGQEKAEAVWRPLLDWLRQSPRDYAFASEPLILTAPARHFWDPAFLRKLPGIVLADDRPGAPESNVFWAGNLEEAGQVMHAYQSAWLPARLLEKDRQQTIATALFAASRHWSISLHFNKGLAGAPPEAIEAARNTATNPAVLDAFALAISGAEGPPAYPGVSGREPDLALARTHAQSVGRAMDEIRKLVPAAGSYISESNYFDTEWRNSFWGANYARLIAVKDKYDPDGLFFAHHGVGSERWSADGFTKLQ